MVPPTKNCNRGIPEIGTPPLPKIGTSNNSNSNNSIVNITNSNNTNSIVDITNSDATNRGSTNSNKKEEYNSLHSLYSPKESPENEPPFDIEDKKMDMTQSNDSYPKHITSTAIQELYNTICISLPRCTLISESRKRAIGIITKNFTVEQIEQAFRKAEASDFITGRDNRWKASFDWLMNSKNLLKVLEGNYDNKESARESVDKNNTIEKMNPNSLKGFKIF